MHDFLMIVWSLTRTFEWERSRLVSHQNVAAYASNDCKNTKTPRAEQIATTVGSGKCSITTTMAKGKYPVQPPYYTPAPKNYQSTNVQVSRDSTRSNSVSSSNSQQNLNTGGLPDDFKVVHDLLFLKSCGWLFFIIVRSHCLAMLTRSQKCFRSQSLHNPSYVTLCHLPICSIKDITTPQYSRL